MLALRFQRHDQEYKVPFNFHIGGKEIPVGLGATTLVLLATAVANLFSKEYATKFGIAFTIGFFILFTISEKINSKRHKKQETRSKNSTCSISRRWTPSRVHARPGSVLVAVRNVNNMSHLRRTLQRTNLRRNDIVVMTVRPLAPDSEYDLKDDQVFGSDEKELFTAVVNMAEKEGKPVELLVVPAINHIRRAGADRGSTESFALDYRRIAENDLR